MKSRIGKQNILMILFSVLLIMVTMLVVLSTTWSRYQTSTVVEVPFEVKKPGTFYILGLEKNEDGTVTEVEEISWVLEENGNYEMNLRVTNDKSDSEENETEYYKLQVATTLGVAPVEESEENSGEQTGSSEEVEIYKGLSLVVTTPNGLERVYKGVAEEFSESSVLYEEIGPGYLYRFFDMDGNELIWKLEGGTYSTQDHRLQIGTIEEMSLMEVIIAETSE